MSGFVQSVSRLLTMGFLLSCPMRGEAHGDVHGQILALTQEIEKQPRNAELYLRRGELHRVHGDWDGALADYELAQALDPGMTILDLARGRLFLEAGWPRSAKVALDRFLSRHRSHAIGLTARARALAMLGDREGAVSDYDAALALSREPTPDLYIERAKALSTEEGGDLERALRGLEEAMVRLGPLVTLQLYAIDLEVRLQRVDAALARLDAIALKSPRKETWFARRGEILQATGRSIEARASYRNALEAIDRLPASRASVPAMQELRKRVDEALVELREPQEGEER